MPVSTLFAATPAALPSIFKLPPDCVNVEPELNRTLPKWLIVPEPLNASVPFTIKVRLHNAEVPTSKVLALAVKVPPVLIVKATAVLAPSRLIFVPLDIFTTSPAVGATPLSHFVPSLQLPVAIELTTKVISAVAAPI